MELPGLPPIPTDSYHKFKALAGVWMVVGSYVLNGVGIFYVQREWFELEVRAATMNADAHALETDLDVSEKRLVTHRRERADINGAIKLIQQEAARLQVQPRPLAREVALLERRVEQLREQDQALTAREEAAFAEFDALRAQGRQLWKDSAVIAVAGQHAKILLFDIICLILLMCMQGIFGFYLARDGFKGWRRLQEHEEAVLSHAK